MAKVVLTDENKTLPLYQTHAKHKAIGEAKVLYLYEIVAKKREERNFVFGRIYFKEKLQGTS